MSTVNDFADAAPEAAARPTLHAHHDADAANSFAERAVRLADSAEALRAATARRGFAAAIPSTLAQLEIALQALAATADGVRVETLWQLRDIEPAAGDEAGDDAVDACARDFSRLAGSLYAARQANVYLRERMERPPWQLRASYRLAASTRVGSVRGVQHRVGHVGEPGEVRAPRRI